MPDEGPLTPEAVTAEVTKAATDPSHPQYQNYQRGLPAYNEWADNLYRRIAPGLSPQAETQRPLIRSEIVPGASDEVVDTAFRSAVDNAVQERGLDLKVVNAEGKRLFGGAAGKAVLDVLEERTLLGLAPQAEVQAHVVMGTYLADLNALRANAPQGNAEPMAPDAFQAALAAALAKQGMSLASLQELEDHLFSGREAEYKHFVKYLDSFPPGARLAAYVRSAEALMAFSRLCQAQS